MASTSSNPKPPEVAAKIREEGELSSSGDDENPLCSTGDPTVAAKSLAASGSVQVPSVNRTIQSIHAGKASSSVATLSSVDVQPQKIVKPNNVKNFEKSRLTFNASKRGWYAPSGSDNNLVISFSDNDSDSEYEDDRQENIKSDVARVDGDQRLPSIPSKKSKAFEDNVRPLNKVVPKRLSQSRPSFPSMSRTIAGTNPKGVNPSFVEQGSRSQIRNSNTSNKGFLTHERGSSPLTLKDTKLQDLRKQIAERERELKLKVIQQSKESIPVTASGYPAMKSGHDAAKKSVSVSADAVSLDPREPDRKRKKVGGSYSTQPNTDFPPEKLSAKYNLQSKQQALESNSLCDRNVAESSKKGSPSKRSKSRGIKLQKQHNDGVDISPGDLPSAHIVSNHQQSNRNSMQASPSHVNNWNYLGTMNLVGHSKRHMQSLVDMEESLDKELEEAQELRRKCEIEERKALKAYRRAQRDLIEANVRCMELYNRRELYSAQVRSFLMNESSLLWSPRQHDHVGSGLHMGDNLTRTLDLVPSSRHQMLSEYDDLILPRCDTSIPYTRASPLSSSYQNINHQNLSSDPCSEPDASLSEPLPHNSNNGANGVSSPSNDPNVSPDDDEETSLLDHRAVLPNFKNQQNEYSIGKQRELSQDSNKSFPVNGSSESLLLEATLRSELFARMGKRALSKNNRLSNMVTSDDVLRTNEDNESERTQTNNGSPPFSEAERNQECENRGKEKPERRNFDVLFHIQNNHNKERNSLEYQPADGSKVDGYSDGSYQFAPSVVLSPPLILRSVFALIQAFPQIASFGLQGQQSKQYKSPNYHPKDFICQENVIKNPMDENAGEICGSESVSFSCNQAIDPFWPLCLYELRGKCNNTACPSQHVRDFSNENEGYHQHEDSHRAGCQVGLPLCSQVCNGAKEELKNHTAVIPTYLVGLDALKTCPHSYESVVARRNAQCWQRCFSMCLCISSLPQIDMRADEPFLRGNNNRIEVHWSSNRQSSYFQSRNGIGDSVNDTISSNMKSLEMALLILNQDVNKIEGMKKALNVLSRALEADPASEILWILYLLIHGSSFKLVGKDDMFSYAVKYNEGSYVLWLMFINSRQHLDDRLLAYNTALAALCRHQLGSVSESDPASASACILDLFLQMMDWLCMSGKVEKAIQTVCGLLAEAPESDEPYSSLLSDILSCLMISDKYIFWVCCVYLVMYRKLPNAVINQFECTKELLEIEWPPVHLIDGEKESALKLLNVALDSVKLEANSESTKTEVGSRLAQKFALIHIRCIAAVDGLECSRIYLEKYMKLYPYCLEFVLISARLQTNDYGGSFMKGFEEALTNWPKEVPGIHCIWNQYIEFVLQRGLPDLAKDLILQWFNSVSKVQHAQNENLEAVNSPHISLESDSSRSPNSLISESARLDLVFGFLNLSLAKLLQNDHFQARRAFDKVLKAAPPPYIKYCLREYARFMLSYKAQAGDVSISEQLNILNTYLEDTVAFFVSEPLSRRFINDIDKLRVQKLVSTILTPVSLESDLVNLCLEVWHGPSLLPQNLSQSKEMVDFVEAVLDMVPSNYQLAFSVFKKLSRDNTLDVTSGSLLFWACSTLVDAIFHAIPIAPEYVWVEASGILGDIADIDMISERFYKRALSAYPFSLKLWHSYYKWVKTKGDASSVLDAAREKGIELS